MTRNIQVHHDQTDWKRVERFRGRANLQLNGTGMKQADVLTGTAHA